MRRMRARLGAGCGLARPARLGPVARSLRLDEGPPRLIPMFFGTLAAAGALVLAASWPVAPTPAYEARNLTAPGRFTENAEGPEFTRAGRLFVVNCERDGTVCEVQPDGRVEVFVRLPEGSTANAIRETSKGNLVLADYTGHNVLSLDVATRTVRVRAHDDRLNQPNDLAIRRDDTVFASDPRWSDRTGQLWRLTPDDRLTRIAEGLGTTNGLTFSPDERVLYVAESVQRRIWAYEVDAAGNLGPRRLFAAFADHGLDGIKCDTDGRLFVARYGKGTIAIFGADGRLEREVTLAGRNASNLVFGGPDGRTVFVTLQDLRGMQQFGAQRPGARWGTPSR